jgi:hypothetical protein
MSKDKLSDYDSTTASNNTDVGGISVAEGMLPSAVNNSIRELTKQLGAFADGTDAINAMAVAGDININSGASKILFTRDDTTVISGNPLGSIEFAHTDTDDAGTAAKIIGEGNGTAGEGRLAFYAGTPSALTEKLRIDSDGIKFNGDTSVDNALSDYEEGTWTPVGNAASGSDPTFTAAGANYTRIGRTVHVTAILSNVNTTGTTGNQPFRIGGLPYTPDTGDTFGSVVTSLVDMDNVNNSVVMADASADVLTFWNQRHNQDTSTPQLGRTNIDHQHIIDDESDFYFSITYYTSQ